MSVFHVGVTLLHRTSPSRIVVGWSARSFCETALSPPGKDTFPSTIAYPIYKIFKIAPALSFVDKCVEFVCHLIVICRINYFLDVFYKSSFNRALESHASVRLRHFLNQWGHVNTEKIPFAKIRKAVILFLCPIRLFLL